MPTVNDDGRLALTEPEAAKRLGFSREAMRRWRRLGTGPVYTRIGGPNGPVRYLPRDLAEFLERGRVGSRAEELARGGAV